MIKIKNESIQELSKDDFIVKGNYNRCVKIFGIRVFKRESHVDNKVLKDNFKNQTETVGFGSKNGKNGNK